MNNALPIIVKTPRWFRGLQHLLLTGALAAHVHYYYLVVSAPELYDAHRSYVFESFMAVILGILVLLPVWESFAPRIVIIDEDGIGGRFVGGGFVGAKKIAWEDITGARLVKMTFMFSYMVLDVNNTGGKYRPKHKRQSAFANAFFNYSINYQFSFWHVPIPFLFLHAFWRLFRDGWRKKEPVFAFNIITPKWSREQAEEAVAVILDRAKGKPPAPPESGKAEESGKSPFAAD